MSDVNSIELDPLTSPKPRIPEVAFICDILPGESGPDAVQQELLGRIRTNFPHLWKDIMSDLQREGLNEHGDGYRVFCDPDEMVASASAWIPLWEEDYYEPGTPYSADNYHWMLHLEFGDAPELSACTGIVANFSGAKFDDVVMHW